MLCMSASNDSLSQDPNNMVNLIAAQTSCPPAAHADRQRGNSARSVFVTAWEALSQLFVIVLCSASDVVGLRAWRLETKGACTTWFPSLAITTETRLL